jgi:hypothetical protein
MAERAPSAETIADLLDALSESVEHLRVLAEQPEERWQARPQDGGWCAMEGLAHLRSSDDILASRLVQIAVRDEPLLPSFDERRWQQVMGYAELPAEQVVEGFCTRREELLFTLGRLPLTSWRRTGTHEESGPVTLLAIAELLLSHEQEHLRQIESALGAAG